MKNNHPIPHNHFKKTNIKYKTWFHDHAQKQIRSNKRKQLAKKVYPMPAIKLLPIVRCPTLRHNKKERLGRGYTPEECKEAGLDYMHARNLGIRIDLRRRNQNMETFSQNVERLKIYVNKLVVYKNRKEARSSNVDQFKGKVIMPIVRKKPSIGEIKTCEIVSKVWAADKVRELIEEVRHKRVVDKKKK